MKQVKVNNILYVMDTEAYQITEDTDVDIIYVPEDHYDEYVAAQWGQVGELITGDEVARIQGVLSKMQKYNYNCIVVNVPDYVIEAEKKDKEYSQIILKYVVETDGNYEIGELVDSWSGTKYFTEVEIDGVVQDTISNEYYLTEGEHIIKLISSDVTLISGRSFYMINELKEAIIPYYTTNIYKQAFQGSGLVYVKLGDNVVNINQQAFAGCSTLTSVDFGNSKPIIGTQAFQNTGLVSINIPHGVTIIGNYSFANDLNLTSITIPNTVTSIGSHAFDNCKNMVNIEIPDSVTNIGDAAFISCSKLASVIVRAITPPNASAQSYMFSSNASGRKIYVPAESVDTYKAASGWSLYANDIEAIPTT